MQHSPYSPPWIAALSCALAAALSAGAQAAPRAARAKPKASKAASKSAKAKPSAKSPKATPRRAAPKGASYGVKEVDGVMIISGGGSLSLPSRPEGAPAPRRAYASSQGAPPQANAGAPSQAARAEPARQKLFPKPFETVDTGGRKINLAQYAGKVTLMDFWATWCPPCRADMPELVALYERNRVRGFDIIGLSLDSDAEALAAFVRSNRMGWRQVFGGKAWESDIARFYGVTSIPYTVLLDRDGSVLAVGLRGKALEAAVERALGGVGGASVRSGLR